MLKEIFPMIFGVFFAVSANAHGEFEQDTLTTANGDLKIQFIGHGSLIFIFHKKVIHVDPYGMLADYSKLPKADILLLTHEHPDHLDLQAIAMIRQKDTVVVLTRACAERITRGIVMDNGDSRVAQGLKIEAVPAYNIVHKRDNGRPFHPRGAGNGYILTFGDKRVYVAGDTENIPEMKMLQGIDVAFLPMNLPYTMTPEMVADAARSIKPKVLYPYHFGDTDTTKIVAALKAIKDIDVRIRRMK